MSISINLSDVVNLQNWNTAASTIDNNSAAIETAFGTAVATTGSSMAGNIDMNSNHVLNLPAPISANEPVRLTDIQNLTSGGSITFNSIPTGGTVGQTLSKNSSGNFDASWISNGVPTGGTPAQVLTKNSSSNYDVAWSSLPASVYTSPLTGGVTRTITSKLSDRVSVKDFGAVGDGVADDTAAIQLAHNTGRLVYYPGGSYKITSTITFSSGGMLGDGTGQSRIVFASPTVDAFVFNGTGGPFSTQVPLFRDICITTGAVTQITGTAWGLRINPSAFLSYFVLDNVTIFGFMGSLIINNADTYTITNSRFLNWSLAGVQISNTLNPDDGDSCISNCLFNTGVALSTSVGILQNSSGGLKISNCKFLGGGYGYRLQWNGSPSTGDLFISNCSIEVVLTAGISLERLSGVTNFGSILIANNEISAPTCIFADTSGAINQFCITGNALAVSAVNGKGVSIGTSNLFTIVGNVLVGVNSGDTGIFTGAGCTNAKIGGNLINGYATPTSLSGTNISTTF